MRFMLEITELMKSLSKIRPIFHSEADFQHALAWHIHKERKNCQVRLEYPFQEKGENRKYLDIWLPKMEIAIELKYKTRKLKWEEDGESFELSDQSARDIGRYNFIRDIARLEKVRLGTAGFAVLLTNDSSYWKSSGKNTLDKNFSLNEGRQLKCPKNEKGELVGLAWSEKKKWLEEDGIDKPIKLGGSYKLEWETYWCFGKENNQQFKYLAVKVAGQTP